MSRRETRIHITASHSPSNKVLEFFSLHSINLSSSTYLKCIEPLPGTPFLHCPVLPLPSLPLLLHRQLCGLLHPILFQPSISTSTHCPGCISGSHGKFSLYEDPVLKMEEVWENKSKCEGRSLDVVRQPIASKRTYREHVNSVKDSSFPSVETFPLSKEIEVRLIRRFCDQFDMTKGMGYMICIHSNKYFTSASIPSHAAMPLLM